MKMPKLVVEDSTPATDLAKLKLCMYVVGTSDDYFEVAVALHTIKHTDQEWWPKYVESCHRFDARAIAHMVDAVNTYNLLVAKIDPEKVTKSLPVLVAFDNVFPVDELVAAYTEIYTYVPNTNRADHMTNMWLHEISLYLRRHNIHTFTDIHQDYLIRQRDNTKVISMLSELSALLTEVGTEVFKDLNVCEELSHCLSTWCVKLKSYSTREKLLNKKKELEHQLVHVTAELEGLIVRK